MAKTNAQINGKNYYRIQRVIDGKKKSFYGASKKEAERKYIEYMESREQTPYCEGLCDTQGNFSDLADIFINDILKPSQKYAHGTIERYASAYNTHVKGSVLSDMPISDVRASDIQSFYNGLDVSMQTLKQVHKFMSAFYKWMVRCGYSSDVLSSVEMPRKSDNRKHEEIVVWTQDEIEKITDNLYDYRYRFFIYVMLYTGMRFSEVLALKYSDIKDATIHVRRQLYLGELKPPKANSVRDIPMHEVLIEEHQKHRAWHRQEMKQNGYESEYLFTTNTGNHVDRSSLDKSIRRFYKRIGIEQKHNHAYRSTFCTQLCKSGVPIEVASKILGHKSILVTAKHYALVQPESTRDAIDLLSYRK